MHSCVDLSVVYFAFWSILYHEFFLSLRCTVISLFFFSHCISLLLHKTEIVQLIILIPLAWPHPPLPAPPSPPGFYWSSDGIDRRVARLLIAAPNEWDKEKMEEGGGDGRGANDSSGEGDVGLINVCCLGSVRILMLIEF